MSKFAGMGLIVDRPMRMELHHPKTGQPMVARTAEGDEPCWIDLLSLDSEPAQKYDREIANRRLSQRVRAAVKAEDLDAERDGRLAVLTAGWRLAALDGTPVDVPCNRAHAEELYRDPAMAWLRDQVMVFLGDRSNFAQASSKS